MKENYGNESHFVTLLENVKTLYLSARPSDLVDDVRKDDVLISSLGGYLLPLYVVPQTDIVAPKRMRHALEERNRNLTDKGESKGICATKERKI